MQNLVGSLPLVIVVVAGVCAPLAGWLAMQRARNPVVWFVFGALIGPLAPLLLVAAPMGRCQRCATPTAGWSATCIECGAGLGGLFIDATDTNDAIQATVAAATHSAVGGPAPAPSVATPAPPMPAVAAPPTVAAAQTVAASLAVGSTSALASGSAASLRARAPESAPVLARDPGQTPSATAPTGQVLATAVYLSGNAGLEIGACYAIARVDDRIRVFGPVDTGQLTIRHERPIDEGEVVALDDRLIITLRHGRSSTSMIMRWVGGMVPTGVEAALAAGSREGQSTDGIGR